MTTESQSVDPGGLAEFSVVFTDRALNHMSLRFQQVMRDLSARLRRVYNAHSIAIVPGGGTYAMEAVARQLSPVDGPPALVVRNGWFSYRWTQIHAAIGAPEPHVLCARAVDGAYVPAPIHDVVQAISDHRPPVVYAAHVETASGVLLPDDYLRQLAVAVHAVGGLLVLDCIASGALWVDMHDIGIDVLLTAPQKGWSGPACAGVVMLSERGRAMVEARDSSSFAVDLKRWLGIFDAYEAGGHAYHATLPTDALRAFGEAVAATEAFGFERARAAQVALGHKVRVLLADHGFPSVAGPGFEAPGVVVSFTDDPDVRSGRAFSEQGVQVAGGVPLRCGEPADFSTFRVGLFGLDKLSDVDGTVARLAQALDAMHGREVGPGGL